MKPIKVDMYEAQTGRWLGYSTYLQLYKGVNYGIYGQ